ncbi:hypothetical protein QTP88_002990 [Uroleucon formosanum]
MNNNVCSYENVLLEEQETMRLWLDGAPPHHTNAVRQLLHYLFPDKLIGRQAGNNAQYRPDITWPPRSPNFNPCKFLIDFYERTTNINNQIPHLLEKTWSSLHHHMEKCIEVNECHIEQLL